MSQFYEPPFPDYLISPLSEAWTLHDLGERFPAINPLSATAVRIEAIESTFVALDGIYTEMLADPQLALDGVLDGLDLEEAQAEHDVMETFIGGVCSIIKRNTLMQDPYATFQGAVRHAAAETVQGIEEGWFGEPIFGQFDVLAGLANSLLEEEHLHVMHHAQETRLSPTASTILRLSVTS